MARSTSRSCSRLSGTSFSAVTWRARSSASRSMRSASRRAASFTTIDAISSASRPTSSLMASIWTPSSISSLFNRAPHSSSQVGPRVHPQAKRGSRGCLAVPQAVALPRDGAGSRQCVTSAGAFGVGLIIMRLGPIPSFNEPPVIRGRRVEFLPLCLQLHEPRLEVHERAAACPQCVEAICLAPEIDGPLAEMSKACARRKQQFSEIALTC